MKGRHFLDISALSAEELKEIIAVARRLKKAKNHTKPLSGRYLAMLFYRFSTRTRVSFDIAMRQLGGETLLLSPQDMQLNRGESVADTARVMSRYVDAMMIRSNEQETIQQFIDHGDIPVINGLTPQSHPCQIMADIMTFEEHQGTIEGKKITWLGDHNNVSFSWMQAAAKFDFEFTMVTPKELQPEMGLVSALKASGARITVDADMGSISPESDLIVTDTWISMDQEEGTTDRHNVLLPYQVNQEVMRRAHPKALFMHCLPAHRGEEVTEEVLDGPQSVVWDEAENRLHIQKAILLWCFQEEAELL